MGMKKIYLILLLILPFIGFGQDMKVKWEDDDGREFSIKVISGEFGYGMIPGDNIFYYPSGKVKNVGGVNISYYPSGKVRNVGRMSISYYPSGKVRSTSGRVR